MATRRLDDWFARVAPGPTQLGRAYALYYDSGTRGFGLRVTRNGAKSWVLNYTTCGGSRSAAFPIGRAR